MTEKEILEKYSTPGLKRNNLDQKPPEEKPTFDKDPPKLAHSKA